MTFFCSCVVQTTIERLVGRSAGFRVSGDEGVLLGATYYAAGVTRRALVAMPDVLSNALDERHDAQVEQEEEEEAEERPSDAPAERVYCAENAMRNDSIVASRETLWRLDERERDRRRTSEMKNALEVRQTMSGFGADHKLAEFCL